MHSLSSEEEEEAALERGGEGRIEEDVVFNVEGLQRHDPVLWNSTHPMWPSECFLSVARSGKGEEPL